ncbi:hypothetical protein INT46_004102 [Mucor plumbeus]|uniref:Wax synthase domain-containing protein n=1 Tax=Mucor plumbeus TaxID=97098 RepID=A0A8H7V1M2_9FUNG|nr:hypothetical protein INT46_004102 [Mucor plumbeus]
MVTTVMANSYPMSIPAYVATAMTPSFIFMVLSLPVKRRNIIQDALLAVLWFTGLAIPIYYAGQFSYLCLISTSVWAWATSMKMGVWVFSMSMEERRQRPFVFTLSDWRKRNVNAPKTLELEPCATSDYVNDIKFGSLLWALLKHEILFDMIDFTFNYADAQRPIRVFSAFMSKIYSILGQTEKAASLAPAEPLTWGCIAISVLMSMLFCVYIQTQLQVTYDIFMITYAVIYKCLPTLERWQLGKDSQKLNTKNIAKSKAILKRIRSIRAVKSYIESTFSMQVLFDSPWTARSLRDFWGRRWHTFYNDCFYRLGYKPIRAAVQLFFNCKPPRWLPALSVFVMSGIMHEYFLYAATGSSLYFGSPLPACGLQFMFFVIQVCGISIGDRFFSRGFLGQLYTVLCMAISCHLFVVPYILTGYLYMERFSFYRIAVNYMRGNPDLFVSIF